MRKTPVKLNQPAMPGSAKRNKGNSQGGTGGDASAKDLPQPGHMAGDLVFVKKKHFPHWPALIQETPQNAEKPLQFQVFYFGTNETGVAKREEIFSYRQCLSDYGKEKVKNRPFNDGLREIAVLAAREQKLRTPQEISNYIAGLNEKVCNDDLTDDSDPEMNSDPPTERNLVSHDTLDDHIAVWRHDEKTLSTDEDTLTTDLSNEIDTGEKPLNTVEDTLTIDLSHEIDTGEKPPPPSENHTDEKPIPSGKHTGKGPLPPEEHTGEKPLPSEKHTGEKPLHSEINSSLHTGEKPSPPSKKHTDEKPLPSEKHTGKEPLPSENHTCEKPLPSEKRTGEKPLHSEINVSLQHGNWLTDAAVDYAISQAVKSCPHLCQTLPAALIQAIKLTKFVDLPDVLDTLSICEKPLLLLPINSSEQDHVDAGTHWSLLVYSVVENTFFHLDSVNGANKKSAEKVALRLNRYYCLDASTVIINIDIPQQQNSADCGIHVALNAELVCAHYTLRRIVADLPSVTLQPAKGRRLDLIASNKGRLEPTQVTAGEEQGPVGTLPHFPALQLLYAVGLSKLANCTNCSRGHIESPPPPRQHTGEKPQTTTDPTPPNSEWQGQKYPHHGKRQYGRNTRTPSYPEVLLENRFSRLVKTHHAGEKPTGEKPFNSRTGEKPFNSHIGEKPLESRTGQKPVSSLTREKLFKANTDQKPFTLHTGEKPYTTHTGDKPWKSHKGDKQCKSQTGEKTHKSHIVENPFKLHTGEKPFTKWRKRHIEIVPGSNTLVFGTSIVKHLSHKSSELSTVSLAGATLTDLKRNLEDNEIQQAIKLATTIVLQGGGNDLANGTEASKLGLLFKDLLKSVHQLNPQARVIICGPLIRKSVPVLMVKLANALLKRFCSSISVGFIDPNLLFSLPVNDCLARDGIHLNFSGVHQLHSVIVNAVSGIFVNLSRLQSENLPHQFHHVRLK